MGVGDWGCNAVVNASEDDRPPLDATFVDRRRQGRVDYQDAQLIPLLRGEPTSTNPAREEVVGVQKVRWTDDLSAGRAILIAVPIGTIIWAMLCAIWYFG